MNLSKFETSIIEVLSYFAIFHHPLKVDEVHRFSGINMSTAQAKETLEQLAHKNLVLESGGYWSVTTDELHKQIKQRKKYEALFQAFIPKVIQNTRLIASFPFVKAIFVSGSMSKGVVKEDGDIDFFIITKQGRLWLCRSLLILYKKIFRGNSHKFFCLNYFVGEESMRIPDENLFTATELASMIPVYNKPVCRQFKEANQWYQTWVPNHIDALNFECLTAGKKPFWSRAISTVSQLKVVDRVDRSLMRLTLTIWQKKFPHFSKEMMALAMRSKRNVSKHHPNNFQQKVLEKHLAIQQNIFNKLPVHTSIKKENELGKI